jgi:hypothetical protein
VPCQPSQNKAAPKPTHMGSGGQADTTAGCGAETWHTNYIGS